MKSFNYHFSGVKITLEHLLKGKFLLYFIPGLIITVIYYWINSKTAAAQSALELTSDYGWLDWVYGGVNSVTSGVFSFFGFIWEQFYIFVVITVLGPFNTALSEKFDEDLTGFKVSFSFISFVNDFLRMLLVVVIAFLMEMAFLLTYWMISWILGLGAIDPVMYFLIAAFFFGFSFYDFSLERYKVSVGGSLAYAFGNMLTMILTGGIFLLIYKIPFIGIPLAPVLTVMISTVVYLYSTNRLPIKTTEITNSNE